MSLNSIKFSRVLLSPLNKGIEHVSRTVPIIRNLLQHKNKVYICCNEEQEAFYRYYFPELWYIPHHGYPPEIIEEGGADFPVLSKFWTLQQLFIKEQKKVDEWVGKFQIDLIVSDQRLGFISSKAKSIIISHQLNLSYLGCSTIQRLWYKNRLSNFDEIWIPDTSDQKYSKDLSNGRFKNKHYIGSCSRFQNDAIDKLIPQKIRYKYLGIVQNNLVSDQKLLQILIQKLSETHKKCAIIVPSEFSNLEIKNSNVVLISAPQHGLFIELMLASEQIIGRPSYTTIMDLLETQNKSILIPDPTQKEQLYFAKVHKNQPAWTFLSKEMFIRTKL